MRLHSAISKLWDSGFGLLLAFLPIRVGAIGSSGDVGPRRKTWDNMKFISFILIRNQLKYRLPTSFHNESNYFLPLCAPLRRGYFSRI